MVPHCLTCTLPKGRVWTLLSLAERLQDGDEPVWVILGQFKFGYEQNAEGWEGGGWQESAHSCLLAGKGHAESVPIGLPP